MRLRQFVAIVFGEEFKWQFGFAWTTENARMCIRNCSCPWRIKSPSPISRWSDYYKFASSLRVQCMSALNCVVQSMWLLRFLKKHQRSVTVRMRLFFPVNLFMGNEGICSDVDLVIYVCLWYFTSDYFYYKPFSSEEKTITISNLSVRVHRWFITITTCSTLRKYA